MNGIVEVNAEQFKDSVFVTIRTTGIGFRRQVRDQNKLAQYLAQLEAEVRAKQEAGEEVNTGAAAVTGSNGNLPRNTKAGKALTVTKTLIFSPALEALKKHLSQSKAKITSPPEYGGYANATGIMDGLFEVSKGLVPRLKADIDQAQDRMVMPWTDEEGKEHPGFLTAFLADYPAAIERARTMPVLEGGLGPLFNEADYPGIDAVEAAFGIEKRLLSLNVPEGLSPEDRAEALGELQQDLRNAADMIKEGLRAGMLRLLEHAKDVLTVRQGEKPKVIKESLIGNVMQFCETFDLRNTRGDNELSALVAQAKEALTGIDPEKCRKDETARAQAAEVFTQLTAAYDAMITSKRGRIVDLSED